MAGTSVIATVTSFGGEAGIFLSVPVMAAIKIIVTHARASQKATARVATVGKVELPVEAVE